MSRLWLLAVLLGWAGAAVAQFPPCYRSKYSNEWPVKVAHVELLDGNKLSRREKATVIRELRRQCDCWPCALSDDVSDQIREIYQWFGYFQAVADVDIKKLGIDSYAIKARVEEGPQYRLGEISFSNVKAFPAADLRKLFALTSGDLFDMRLFRRGVERLRMLYGTRGYLNFSAIPDTSVNSAKDTITVRIDVDEGPVFHLGPLVLIGLDSVRGFGKKIQDEWRPHMGEVYNSDFVDGFLTQHLSVFDQKMQVTYMQDAKAGTVAVRVEFKKPETAER